jgi:hypothetical protein
LLERLAGLKEPRSRTNGSISFKATFRFLKRTVGYFIDGPMYCDARAVVIGGTAHPSEGYLHGKDHREMPHTPMPARDTSALR